MHIGMVDGSDDGSGRPPARPTRRRLLAGAAGAVTVAGLASVMKPAPAAAIAPGVFYMVKHNGDLIWSGNFDQRVGWGWEPARLLAGLNDDRFIEVKWDGRLWEWVWDGQNMSYTHRGHGFTPENTRLVAGLDSDHFLEVKQDGRLAYWYRSGATFAEQIRGSGWTSLNTTMISGASRSSFYEVREEDGGLSKWTYSSGAYHERRLSALVGPPYGFTFSPGAMISGISDTSLWEITGAGFLNLHRNVGTDSWSVLSILGDYSDVRLIST